MLIPPFPEVLQIALGKPLIKSINLLPARKAAIEDIDLLHLLRRGGTRSGLPLPQILQGRARPPLLAQGAVEDDDLLVREPAQKRRHRGVEAAAGEV